MISVIIPARNEKYLTATVDSLYENAGQDFELIIALDGKTQHPLPSPRQNMTIVDVPESQGIRPTLNAAVEKSKGDYILKLDGHCIVGENFISTLAKNCEDDWVVVARRFTLDLTDMSRQPRIVDYYYLSCPWTNEKSFMMQSCPWITRTEERMDIPLDNLMCFQGSMWFTSRNHWQKLGGLETNAAYAEHHEISMKTWLGGGKVIINKDAWYAHPAKIDRGYHMSMRQVFKDHARSAKFWTKNEWQERVYDFDWLIDKFWPLPLEKQRHRLEKYYWPTDWRKHYAY